MSVNFSLDFVVSRNEDSDELPLQVSGSYHYDPGMTYGPPENCYPAEEDINYNIFLNGVEWQGELTKTEQDYLEEAIRLKVGDDLDCAYEEEFEYDRYEDSEY